MIIYSWKIEGLEAYPQAEAQTNVVFSVRWRLNAVNGEYTATCYGTVGVAYVAGTAYTEYKDLTQQQVETWVETALGAETIQQYKTSLASNIAAQINPTAVMLPPPWL
jgi:hypothetical protein